MIGNARCTVFRFYRRFKPSLLGLSLIVGVLCATTGKAAQVFPIEVMGPPPHSETAELKLAPGKGSAAKTLRLRAHNVAYDGKGRMRVNGGAWYGIWNDVAAIKVAQPDRLYGGFGGGFSTVKFTLGSPHVSFREGVNTIEFEYSFKHADFATAGYRIVDIDILDDQDRSVLAAGEKSFDDPRTWGPPLTNAAAIAAGKEIWTNHNGVDGTNCKDCHTETGRDLKYFNVSNKTIIEQCKKSGFSELQGEQVASYIRTLEQEVVLQARPWNPPYQPGPGTDSRHVYQWAAGAGLDAVLKSDADMLPYIFGEGTQDEINAAANINGTMNLREMPVAVQFPDWIHWLPRTHPRDVWGLVYWKNAKNRTDVDTALNPDNEWNNPYKSYQEIKRRFAEEDLANSPDLIEIMYEEFQRNILWWIGDGHSGHPWTDLKEGNIAQAKINGFTAAEAKLNLSRWRAVKLWELVHTNAIEDKAIGLGATDEKYVWPVKGFATFQIAAHFIGDNRATSAFAWESLEAGTYFSSIWYQLQMVLNSGMKMGEVVSPVDWAYNHYHINRLGERTGIYEPLRLTQNLIKCYQERNRPGHVIDEKTWSMREISPWRLYSDYKGDDSTYRELDNYGFGSALRLRILRTMLNQFLNRCSLYEPSDWPRTRDRFPDRAVGGTDNWYRIERPNYIPQEEPDEITNFKMFAQTGAGDAIEADAMYRLIPKLQEIGLNRPPVDRLAAWCETLWPNADWAKLVEDVYAVNEPPVFLSPASADHDTRTVVQNTTLRVEAQDPNPRDFLTYSWSTSSGGGTVIFEDPSSPNTRVSFTVPGTFEFMVTVSDGKLESTSSVTVIVTAAKAGQFIVGFTSHGDNERVEVGDPINVSVYATRGGDGTNGVGIKRVNLSLGIDSISAIPAPFEWELSDLPVGTYTLRAKAVPEEEGVDALTAVIHIDVFDDSIVNTAPVAQPQSVTTNQNSPVEITLGGSDAENDRLSYRIVSDPSNGVLSGGPRTFIFTPESGFDGRDSFTFKVNDGELDSASARVNVTVLGGANNRPVANPQSLTTVVDTPLPITLSGSDVETASLSYHVASDPSKGRLTGTPPDVTYTPNAGYIGLDSFTFTAYDGTDHSSPATINIRVEGIGNSKPVIESRPSASPASISLSDETELEVTARDPDGDTLNYMWTKLSGPGTVAFTAPRAAVTKAEFSEIGEYELQVIIGDGTDNVNEKVTVTVHADGVFWVDIESHKDGMSYEKSDDFVLRVGAGGATIKRVGLNINDVWHGAKTATPYTFELGDLPLGKYKFEAVAVDADDDTKKSRQDITIWIVEPNIPPTLWFGEPSADISNLAVGSSVNVSAVAGDTDGTVATVELFLDGRLIDTLRSSPYSFGRVTIHTLGIHELKLVATDDDDATTEVTRSVTVGETAGKDDEDDEDDDGGCGCSTSDGSPVSTWLVIAILSVIVFGRRRFKYC